MSNVDTPPNPYFSGINFNPSFFLSIASNYLTEAIANSKYLRLVGGILSGNLGIGRTPRVELDVNGKAVIDNGLATLPGNGILGSNGTRLILFPGTVSETPFAIGISADTLWYGVASTGNHSFYTGTTMRMRIRNDGNVGIGTDNPISLFHLHNTLSGGEIKLSLTDGSTGVGNTDGFSIIKTAIDEGHIWNYENSPIIIGTNNSERMRIDNNGSVGIGTNTATSVNTKLTIRGSSAGFSQPLVKITQTAAWDGNYALEVDGYTNLNGFRINAADSVNSIYQNLANVDFGFAQNEGNTTGGNILFTVHGAAGNILFRTSGGNERMRINPSGYVGIATTNPANIFQVGSGARLRISNSSADYTLIGTSDADGSNNTRIIISGNTRTGSLGKIQYIATTETGEHLFYFNGNTQIATLAYDNVFFYRSPRAVGCNYQNEGVFVAHSTKINVGGTSQSGYFIPINNYTNSLMTCAFSQDSTVYTYWHGHVSIGDNNQILNIINVNTVNMTVESFTEQTTLTYFIRVVPSVSFVAAVQLKAKIYG